jgi:hypothetical protein
MVKRTKTYLNIFTQNNDSLTDTRVNKIHGLMFSNHIHNTNNIICHALILDLIQESVKTFKNIHKIDQTLIGLKTDLK